MPHEPFAADTVWLPGHAVQLLAAPVQLMHELLHGVQNAPLTKYPVPHVPQVLLDADMRSGGKHVRQFVEFVVHVAHGDAHAMQLLPLTK